MKTEKDYLILVDENDIAWGKLEKDLVHEKGILHRAFSVFIFNSESEMLLQQRADGKYHSAGLWTNTCCSHPRYGEELADAVERRLWEEMKIKCDAQYAFSFLYNETLENGLIENEFDHVFIGNSDAIPFPDPEEVKNWKYESIENIKDLLTTSPEIFTVWFRIIFDRVIEYRNSLYVHL